MPVRPLNDRVLLQRQEAQTTTAGGIIIPDKAQEKPQNALVIAVGPKATDVKKGDVVLLSKYTGTDVTVDGESMLLVKEEELLGIVEK